MLSELAEPGFLSTRASLLWVLALSAVTLAGWGQALRRWRQFKLGPMRTAALPYRGWSIAFAILFACLQIGCFGTYWLLLAAGELIEADVQQVTVTHHGGRTKSTTYRLFAVSANAARWPLEDSIPGIVADTVQERLRGQNGSLRVPFVVVPFWPAVHQLGARVNVNPAPVFVAVLVLVVLLPVYGLAAPALAPSHGRFFWAFLDGLAALGGAAYDQLAEVAAMLSIAMLTSRQVRGEPVTWVDPLCVLALSACIWVLLRNIVRPRARTLTIRRFGTTTFGIPSSSVFHFIFDAGWLAAGIALLQPPRSEVSLAFGVALVAVPGVLVIARLLCWRRRVID